MYTFAFQPLLGASVPIAVGASTSAPTVVNAQPSLYPQIRVFNSGTAPAWVNFGGSGVTASMTADIALAAGEIEVFTIPSSGPVYAAVIAAGPTGSVYFTPGEGI